MGLRFTDLRVRSLLALALLGALALVFPGAGCGSKSGLPLWDFGPIEAGADVGQQPQCGTFSIRGALAPLDLFIMMDTSGSMRETTAEGIEKIEAMRAALEGFLKDPKSAGIGVTISFFPIMDPTVPDLCAEDWTCGQPGACAPLFVCYPFTTEDLVLCGSNKPCGFGQTCERLGYCGGYELCVPGVQACLSGAACTPGGLCLNTTVCDWAAYTPTAAPQVLPGGATSVLAKLSGKEPEGSTPTLPALEGAIQAAIANSSKFSDHKSIVLLATDGFPTACDPAIPIEEENSPAGIPKLVEAAKQGNAAGVQTFVIGVFAPKEAALAQQNLSAIADAGGSQTAYVVQTNEPVSQKVLASLNAIRTAATDCSYALPQPGGTPLDATKIQVSLIGSGGTSPLPQLKALEDCGDFGAGFVFDKDPWGLEPPALIQLCPASCQAVRADPDLDIQVKVACD